MKSLTNLIDSQESDLLFQNNSVRCNFHVEEGHRGSVFRDR